MHGSFLDAGDLSFLERFDDVAGLEVLEVRQADSTFKSGPNFSDILFEVAKRLDRSPPDDRAFPKEPDLGVAGDGAA